MNAVLGEPQVRNRPGSRGMMAATRSAVAQLALGGFWFALGLGVALNAKLIAVAALATVPLLAFVLRSDLFWWDILVWSLGGALVLGYGFANVGISLGGIPVPIAEVAALLLLARAQLTKTFRWPMSGPWMFAAGFFAVASIRLLFDVRHWGETAVRDFTLPIEFAFLPLGYWALRTYTIDRWIRALSLIFLVALPYFLLMPLQDSLAAVSPVVGLQRPVALFGQYASAGVAAAAGLFFFALVRPFGRTSYLIAGAFCVPLALKQSRGLYLALLGCFLLLWLLSSGRPGGRVKQGIVGVLAASGLVLALLIPIAPQGRLGPVSPSFASSQLKTLLGEPGPGAGSYQRRREWLHDVVRRVEGEPGGWLIGVGLGPDLASGFKLAPDIPVRKPHNDYLEVLARLGLVGFVPFIGVFLTALTQIVTAARRGMGADARFLWWVIATATVYLIIAATQPLLSFPYGTVPLFLILGAGLAIADTARTSRSRSVEQSRTADVQPFAPSDAGRPAHTSTVHKLLAESSS